MLCDTCSNRDLCTSLCPEAELYVKQDYHPQREKPIGLPKPSRWPTQVSNIYLTPSEVEILTLLGQGLSRADVCQVLKITRVTLRVHLSNIKSKS